MRKLILIIVVLGLLLPELGVAEGLGIKKRTEYISMPLREPIDSTFGIARKPDSAIVVVSRDNADGAVYTGRNQTWPFSGIGIDAIIAYGDTTYRYRPLISNIDGGEGNFTLTLQVTLYTGKYGFTSFGTVQVISDSLNYDLKQARDSSGAAARFAKAVEDSLGDGLLGPFVDLIAIGGDQTAASNLRNKLNGTASPLVTLGDTTAFIGHMLSKLDTVLYIAGHKVGASYSQHEHPDYDTSFYFINGVLVLREIFRHIGGQPGDPPDTSWLAGP